MQVNLYDEELVILAGLLNVEINEIERADTHGFDLEYQLFLHSLREKLLRQLGNDGLDEPRPGRVS